MSEKIRSDKLQWTKAGGESSLPVLEIGACCRATRLGLEYQGKIENIIHLSNGKTLIVILLPFDQIDLFDARNVFPLNGGRWFSNNDVVDKTLKRFEPKGMSTLAE